MTIKESDINNRGNFKIFNNKQSVIIWFIPLGYFYTMIRFLIQDL